ncbi:MAG: hypothetical protein AAF802_05770, partial [Planctomycetota bacterium]
LTSPNWKPESFPRQLRQVKQEPYTDPYVRFCERAESAVAPLAHPTRFVNMKASLYVRIVSQVLPAS